MKNVICIKKKSINMNELQFRLNLIQIELPALFYNGKYIGNCDQIESYSDQGILKKLFKDLEVNFGNFFFQIII